MRLCPPCQHRDGFWVGLRPESGGGVLAPRRRSPDRANPFAELGARDGPASPSSRPPSVCLAPTAPSWPCSMMARLAAHRGIGRARSSIIRPCGRIAGLADAATNASRPPYLAPCSLLRSSALRPQQDAPPLILSRLRVRLLCRGIVGRAPLARQPNELTAAQKPVAGHSRCEYIRRSQSEARSSSVNRTPSSVSVIPPPALESPPPKCSLGRGSRQSDYWSALKFGRPGRLASDLCSPVPRQGRRAMFADA